MIYQISVAHEAEKVLDRLDRALPVADVRATQRLPIGFFVVKNTLDLEIFAVIAEEDPRVPGQTQVAKDDDLRHRASAF